MELAIPVLPADDLGVAKAFYVDALGFDVAFEVTEDGRTGLLGVQRGTIQITLDCPMDGHGRHACVSLRVDNADRYYDEWSARTEVKAPRRNQPWAREDLRRTDPFGNTHLHDGLGTSVLCRGS
jgi:uncharacterized glyoxalase superfamily protein PhnB